ncbi:MAG: TetR/AcrR family transcriptional regulator, partial [bacterium]|nr:TetR/AcrR family transcriptional regulator [bacterium]
LNMDLRVKRTRSSIINAFLQLRAKKTLERISVKEMSELAGINKATFYLHYKDIYDLSEKLENELFERIFKSIEHPDAIISDTHLFIKELIDGFTSNQSMIDIIFSNERSNILVDRLEKSMKDFVYKKYPEYSHIPEIDIFLTYSIKGGYYAFAENKSCDIQLRTSVIGDIAEYISGRIVADVIGKS